MAYSDEIEKLFATYITPDSHQQSNYFGLIHALLKAKTADNAGAVESAVAGVYELVHDEMCTNTRAPSAAINFGTSGWRGILGKDVFVRSVACVTAAIIEMYSIAARDQDLLDLLGVSSLEEAKKRGCVVGHDNRFGGELLAGVVVRMLSEAGFAVYHAGESTTGVLSAAVLQCNAAFSVNLTPSHNPLEYGGYKYNAADAGPAASRLTETITTLARKAVAAGFGKEITILTRNELEKLAGVQIFDSLSCWQDLVIKNESIHGILLTDVIHRFQQHPDLVVVVDSVHGASRLHIRKLLDSTDNNRLITIRDDSDVTFGGIAPEPSSANMKIVRQTLRERSERFKLGAIIDPDGDRIRFADGEQEISMNQFGAMAYHFLHVYKMKRGLVAKTVATSNLANRLAESFGQELFEPRVGFKEFKPVIGQALVLFEESDGISIIGHTPEKDAYIGLLLALDMVLTTGKNLSEYLHEIEAEFGAYYPDRDGVSVSLSGKELLASLAALEQYGVDSEIDVGTEKKRISEVITIDGRKMIFTDGSWLMIRPSGTEPKVRFYVESRDKNGTAALVDAARTLLADMGLL